MLIYVGLGSALPHSSDRNDGGDDGVGTGLRRVGRRLGRRAFITFGYHRRPPARTRAGLRGPAPGFPAKPLRRKSVPNLGRAWGEPSLLPFGCNLVRLQLGQIRVARTAIRHHLLHSHTSSFPGYRILILFNSQKFLLVSIVFQYRVLILEPLNSIRNQ